MFPEEGMKVSIVVLEHEGNVLPTLPSVDVRGAECRALAKPLTDAVHTQEFVFFGYPFIAGPEGSYFIVIGPKFPIDDGIAGRVETLELL